MLKGEMCDINLGEISSRVFVCPNKGLQSDMVAPFHQGPLVWRYGWPFLQLC